MGTHVELVADNGDGTLRVAHGGHAGTIPVELARAPDGSADRSGLILTCPTCGASSYWPTSGGAAPEQAAELEAIAEAAPAMEAKVKPAKPKKG
jgi:hypothetical protein